MGDLAFLVKFLKSGNGPDPAEIAFVCQFFLIITLEQQLAVLLLITS